MYNLHTDCHSGKKIGKLHEAGQLDATIFTLGIALAWGDILTPKCRIK